MFDEIHRKIIEGLEQDKRLEELMKAVNIELIKANVHMQIFYQLRSMPEPLMDIMDDCRFSG